MREEAAEVVVGVEAEVCWKKIWGSESFGWAQKGVVVLHRVAASTEEVEQGLELALAV